MSGASQLRLNNINEISKFRNAITFTDKVLDNKFDSNIKIIQELIKKFEICCPRKITVYDFTEICLEWDINGKQTKLYISEPNLYEYQTGTNYKMNPRKYILHENFPSFLKFLK